MYCYENINWIRFLLGDFRNINCKNVVMLYEDFFEFVGKEVFFFNFVLEW